MDDLFDLEVGEDVGVLGFPGVLETTYNPFTLVPTPTFKSGTISALRPYDSSRPLLSGTQTLLLGKVVQHNLGIAPGNSGSPIFNKRGEVVAIANSGIQGSAAFDFGIRADEIRLLIKASYLASNLPPPPNGKPLLSPSPAPHPAAPLKQRR
jgi:S1-C subfamily serine protease